jgi:very-short-patch-repair endonuclease
MDNPPSGQIEDLHRRLSQYYLACLGRSTRPEAKFFAKNKFTPEYAELPSNPFVTAVDISKNPTAKKVIESVKSKKGKQVYVGNIVFADYIESKSSDWKGYLLYPLLITPLEHTSGTIDCIDSPLFINPEAIKKILGLSSVGELQEAVLELEEELGLGVAAGKLQSIDEVLSHLRDKYDYWNWIEELPKADFEGPINSVPTVPLAEINRVGLYTRSVIFLAEKPKYTMGLESELKALSNLSTQDLTKCSLGKWLGYGSGVTSPLSESALIEPIPLNSEQRDAVTRALTQPLTVITGPPGTGKSQVVSSILINAALQGTTVLFSSKNNKAVDVVETRVNSLGQRPILLRLGARNLQERLSDYLTRIVSMKTELEDLEAYEKAKRDHTDLSLALSSERREINSLVVLRNRVDDLEALLERVRESLGEDVFTVFENLNLASKRIATTELSRAVKKNSPEGQGLFVRMFPGIGRKARQELLSNAATSVKSCFDEFNFDIPTLSASLDGWKSFLSNVESTLHAIEQVPEYKESLEKLARSEDLGSHAQRVTLLQEQTAEKSMKLWQAWLRTIPTRLSQSDRKELTKFQSTVNMLARATDGKSTASLKSEQQRLFPTVSKFLPCWAVTSLSIRDRVPFSTGFFDLVVIDEASQCDIASALPLLMRAKRAVIIGDPLQLRHVTNIDASTDRMLLDQHKLMESLEWSYSTQSLFDVATAIRDEDSMITLRDHHRSDSQIIEYSNRQFYDGQLRVATKHDRLLKPNKDEPAIRWVEVKGFSVRPSQGSVTCAQEARTVVEEIERLARQGYKGSIGVVTPFAPQARMIGDLLAQRDDLAAFLRAADNLVATAHSFQGDERDLIIMSPALQSGAPDSAIKFVSAQANLFNVAITRARAALIVVGNSDAKELNKVPHLRAFIEYVDQVSQTSTKKLSGAKIDFGPKFPTDRRDEYVSEFEVKFYEALYAEGIKTTPQLSVDQYRLDLALIDGNRKLDIEVDGELYHRHWTGENIRRDMLRNQRLIELGWDVQRFWVYQVRDDLDNCINRVKKWLR